MRLESSSMHSTTILWPGTPFCELHRQTNSPHPHPIQQTWSLFPLSASFSSPSCPHIFFHILSHHFISCLSLSSPSSPLHSHTIRFLINTICSINLCFADHHLFSFSWSQDVLNWRSLLPPAPWDALKEEWNPFVSPQWKLRGKLPSYLSSAHLGDSCKFIDEVFQGVKGVWPEGWNSIHQTRTLPLPSTLILATPVTVTQNMKFWPQF